MNIYRLLAALLVAVHAAFVLFVVFGGFLVLKWKRVAWVHVPAAVWGTWIELMGWICPLTPLENWLRSRGGTEVYRGGFIENYLLGALYPEGLTRQTQILLGVGAFLLNAVIYTFAIRRAP